MNTHTIVVEFPEGVSPTYSYSTEVLGGRVVAVAFDGDRLQVEEQLLEALQDLIGWVPGPAAWHHDGATTAVAKARAAIARAQGKS